MIAKCEEKCMCVCVCVGGWGGVGGGGRGERRGEYVRVIISLSDYIVSSAAVTDVLDVSPYISEPPAARR